jgi:hypothetical protein
MIIETRRKGTEYGPLKNRAPCESPRRFADGGSVGGNGGHSLAVGGVRPVRSDHGDRCFNLDSVGAPHAYAGGGAKTRPIAHHHSRIDGDITCIAPRRARPNGNDSTIAYRDVLTKSDSTAISDASARPDENADPLPNHVPGAHGDDH